MKVVGYMWESGSTGLFQGCQQSQKLLVAPKDKDIIYNKGGVIYR